MNAATGFTRIAQDQPVAVLVDGENISADNATLILDAARTLGPIGVRRVYGNVGRLPAWEAAPGFTAIHTQSNKNSADMRLTVDAMDLFLRADVRSFLLASSDGDFTHLATYLRDSGAHVTGLGAIAAGTSFKAACHRFVAIDAPPAAPPQPPSLAAMKNHLIAALKARPRAEGLAIADINPLMRQLHPICIADHPVGSWRAFLGLYPELFAFDPKGPRARVRLRKPAPAPVTAPSSAATPPSPPRQSAAAPAQ